VIIDGSVDTAWSLPYLVNEYVYSFFCIIVCGFKASIALLKTSRKLVCQEWRIAPHNARGDLEEVAKISGHCPTVPGTLSSSLDNLEFIEDIIFVGNGFPNFTGILLARSAADHSS
jgi:hypothetical protein